MDDKLDQSGFQSCQKDTQHDVDGTPKTLMEKRKWLCAFQTQGQKPGMPQTGQNDAFPHNN